MRIYFLENMFFSSLLIYLLSTMSLLWIYICCNPESSLCYWKNSGFI